MSDSPGLMPSPQIGVNPDKGKDGFSATIKKNSGATAAKGTGSKNDPLVYLGYTKKSPNDQISLYRPGSQPVGVMAPGKAGYGIVSPDTRPLSSVQGDFYEWDNKTKNKFLTQLNLAGYDTSKMR